MAKTVKERNKEKIDKHGKDFQNKRAGTKKYMKERFKKPLNSPRSHDIASQCGQHAANHPLREIGMVQDHITKLEALEDARNKSDLPASFKGKYASDLIDLNVLLSELKAMPDEPAYPELEGET